MAYVKVKFRASTVDTNSITIFYQIIHNRISRCVCSNIRLRMAEWNSRSSRIMVTDGCDDLRSEYLSRQHRKMRYDIERLNRIIRRWESLGVAYTAEDVAEDYRQFISDYSIVRFMERLISDLRLKGKVRTAEIYRTSLNSFVRFMRSQPLEISDMLLDMVDTQLMDAYEQWLRDKHLVPNTISFYLRVIRAAYNRAVNSNIIESRKPFRNVYTGVAKTVKRALPLATIRSIYALDLSQYPLADYARDMFLLSFMLRGMSFVDMAFLRKSDLSNGYIIYRRRKTGQQLIIAWTSDMQALLDKYPENQSQYLLPIIRREGICERSVYRNVGYNINRGLKKIAKILGLTVPLTLYVARHSWASIARSKGIPLSVISEGMGHESESTTRIYLASLDTSLVDNANNLILSSLH